MNDPLARYLQQRAYRNERRLRLRRLKTNEALDLGARAYQQTGWPMLQAVALPSLFCLAGFAFFWSYAFPAMWSTRDTENAATQVGEAAGALAMCLFVAVPLFLIGAAYSMAVVTRLVADFMVGNVPNVPAAIRAAHGKLGALFKALMWQMLVGSVFFLIAVGLLMLSAMITVSDPDALTAPAGIAVIATIALLCGYAWVPIIVCRGALAPAVMMMEDLKPRECLKRSAELLRGERGPSGYETIINGLILIALLYLMGGWGLYSLAGQMGIGTWIADTFVGSKWTDVLDAMFGYLPWYLVIWVTIPLWSTISTIVYFERRVRKEGYDIEILAQDVWRSDQSRRFQL